MTSKLIYNKLSVCSLRAWKKLREVLQSWIQTSGQDDQSEKNTVCQEIKEVRLFFLLFVINQKKKYSMCFLPHVKSCLDDGQRCSTCYLQCWRLNKLCSHWLLLLWLLIVGGAHRQAIHWAGETKTKDVATFREDPAFTGNAHMWLCAGGFPLTVSATVLDCLDLSSSALDIIYNNKKKEDELASRLPYI